MEEKKELAVKIAQGLLKRNLITAWEFGDAISVIFRELN
jgi:hypothetical protein